MRGAHSRSEVEDDSDDVCILSANERHSKKGEEAKRRKKKHKKKDRMRRATSEEEEGSVEECSPVRKVLIEVTPRTGNDKQKRRSRWETSESESEVERRKRRRKRRRTEETPRKNGQAAGYDGEGSNGEEKKRSNGGRETEKEKEIEVIDLSEDSPEKGRPRTPEKLDERRTSAINGTPPTPAPSPATPSTVSPPTVSPRLRDTVPGGMRRRSEASCPPSPTEQPIVISIPSSRVYREEEEMMDRWPLPPSPPPHRPIDNLAGREDGDTVSPPLQPDALNHSSNQYLSRQKMTADALSSHYNMYPTYYPTDLLFMMRRVARESMTEREEGRSPALSSVPPGQRRASASKCRDGRENGRLSHENREARSSTCEQSAARFAPDPIDNRVPMRREAEDGARSMIEREEARSSARTHSATRSAPDPIDNRVPMRVETGDGGPSMIERQEVIHSKSPIVRREAGEEAWGKRRVELQSASTDRPTSLDGYVDDLLSPVYGQHEEESLPDQDTVAPPDLLIDVVPPAGFNPFGAAIYWDCPLVESLADLRVEKRPKKPNKKMFSEVLRDLPQFIAAGEESLIVAALEWKLHTQRNHFENPHNRQFLKKMVCKTASPSASTKSCLRSIIQWDLDNMDFGKRRPELGEERAINEKAPLTLAACPFERITSGGRKKKYTILSEAVIKGKVEWARFLIQNGSNINEVVSYPEHAFNDYIVCAAIENVLAGESGGNDFPMVRLLLSAGANRSRALRFLEGRRRGLILDGKAAPNDFDRSFPQYRELHRLVKSACDHVDHAFQAALSSIPSVTSSFTVGWIRECVCSTAFDLLLPIVDVDEHLSGQVEGRLREGGEKGFVFAVLVGFGSEEIDESIMQANLTVNSIVMVHRAGHSPFAVIPEAKVGQVEFDASFCLQSIDEAHSIFIVPPTLIDRIKHLVVRMKRDRVDTMRPVYAALARLDFKQDLFEDEGRRRRNDMDRRL